METTAKRLQINNLQQILKFTFGILPIAAGLDKFFNLLVQWEMYLPAYMEEIIPFSASAFMMIVGIIEIVAGIIVFTKTEVGAYIVCAWLALIALTLILSGDYLDIAVRDIVMAIAAYVLARMTALEKTPANAHNFA
ncbi:MAG TPA: hypothetical protein VFG39_01545 [Balneolaceae bacterium]|nr:hypothetical protein [Balneolaceae bacterium]